jgi:hypothetical protein
MVRATLIFLLLGATLGCGKVKQDASPEPPLDGSLPDGSLPDGSLPDGSLPGARLRAPGGRCLAFHHG